MPAATTRQALLSAISVVATLVAVSMVAAAVASSGASKRTALLAVRPGMQLWDDSIPLAYEDSFGTENENYDGTEYPTMFNAADADGASWRQYVPLLIWPEKNWFDEDGHYIGRGGGPDVRKTTVTKQIPTEAFAYPQLKEFGVPLRRRAQRQLRLARSL